MSTAVDASGLTPAEARNREPPGHRPIRTKRRGSRRYVRRRLRGSSFSATGAPAPILLTTTKFASSRTISSTSRTSCPGLTKNEFEPERTASYSPTVMVTRSVQASSVHSQARLISRESLSSSNIEADAPAARCSIRSLTSRKRLWFFAARTRRASSSVVLISSLSFGWLHAAEEETSRTPQKADSGREEGHSRGPPQLT